MALTYLDKFCSYLDRENIKYTVDMENIVSIVFSGGDNIPSCDVKVIFDSDGGNTVAFKSWSIGKFKDESKYAKAVILCNRLNAKFRWAKFYVDDDFDVSVESDILVDENNVGEFCLEITLRLMKIMDDAYPDFMKIRWS